MSGNKTKAMDENEWAELYRLREAVKGPAGYETWQDAATAERRQRVLAERDHIAAVAALQARINEIEKPIDMILHCPACLEQHIDEPERSLGPGNTETLDWDNPPHRSHKCKHCGFIWRPADVATNGVAAIKTKGKDDMVLIDGPLEVLRQIHIRDAAQPTLDWGAEAQSAQDKTREEWREEMRQDAFGPKA